MLFRSPVRTLCDVSALALDLNFKDQVRSRHHVQVQSPISTAKIYYIRRLIKGILYRGREVNIVYLVYLK